MPLQFANIVLLDTDPQIGASSDSRGQFELERVPVGRYSIMVRYVGYEDIILPEVVLGSAKEQVLNIELRERLESLGEVSVTWEK